MRRFINPQVYTYETDKSVIKTPNKNISPNLGGPKNNTVVIPVPTPSVFDFLLLEDGFYLLQENNSKIML